MASQLNISDFNQFTTLENSELWFQIIDCDGRLLFMNKFTEAFCGYSSHDFVGNYLFWEKIFNSKESGLRLLNIFRTSIERSAKSKPKLTTIKTKNGQVKHILWSMNVIRDPKGNKCGASIIGFDPTYIPTSNKSKNNPDDRYRHIFRNAPIGFFRSLPEGRFLETNNAFAKLLGYDNPEDVLKEVKNIGNDVYFDQTLRTKVIEQTIGSGKVNSYETVFKDRWNKPFDVRLNISSRYDAEIDNHILEGTLENITARKKAEKELHKNLIKYSTLFEKSPISIWELDYSELKIELDKLMTEVDDLKTHLIKNPKVLERIRQKIKLIDINSATLELFEVSSKEEFIETHHHFSGQSLSDMEYNSMMALINDAMTFEHETTFSTPTSDKKNILTRWVSAPETSRPYSKVLMSMIDITAQRAEQEALSKSENQLSTLLSSMDDLVFIIDIKGKYQYVAPTRPELLISPSEQLVGKYIGDFFNVETTKKLLSAFEESLSEHKTMNIEYPLLIRGNQLWFEAKISPLTHDTVILVSRDITERVNTERANSIMLNIAKAVSTTDELNDLFELIRSEISTVMDTKNFFLALFDAENKTLSLPYFQDEKDHFDQIPTKKTLSALVISQKKSLLLRHDAIIELAEQGKINLVGTTAKVWLGIPIMVEGEVLGLMVVQNYESEDAIHEEHQQLLEMISPQISLSIKRKQSEQLLKESETQLRQSNQTKDRFFNIIAHDLKNPFNAIIGFSSLLTDEWNEFDDDDKISMISSIKSSSEGAYELLMNLLEWSRLHVGKMSFEPEFIDYASLIRLNFSLLKTAADKKNIRLVSDGLCDKMVWADPNMVKTVIRNLLNNAIKFTPSGGTISVECYKTPEMHGMMNLAIKDTGVGIPEEAICEIFNLTKSHSTAGTDGESGTGLGLVLCKEFIEKNNGKIWVESKVDNGSTFHIALPIRP